MLGHSLFLRLNCKPEEIFKHAKLKLVDDAEHLTCSASRASFWFSDMLFGKRELARSGSGVNGGAKLHQPGGVKVHHLR
jgi:hypothetical protein